MLFHAHGRSPHPSLDVEVPGTMCL
jgi:hypothetical protein